MENKMGLKITVRRGHVVIMALPVHLDLNEVPDFTEQEAVARLYNQVETRFQIERKTVNVQQVSEVQSQCLVKAGTQICLIHWYI